MVVKEGIHWFSLYFRDKCHSVRRTSQDNYILMIYMQDKSHQLTFNPALVYMTLCKNYFVFVKPSHFLITKKRNSFITYCVNIKQMYKGCKDFVIKYYVGL